MAIAIERRRTGESPEFLLVDNPDKGQRTASPTGRNKALQKDSDISATATESIPLTSVQAYQKSSVEHFSSTLSEDDNNLVEQTSEPQDTTVIDDENNSNTFNDKENDNNEPPVISDRESDIAKLVAAQLETEQDVQQPSPLSPSRERQLDLLVQQFDEPEEDDSVERFRKN